MGIDDSTEKLGDFAEIEKLTDDCLLHIFSFLTIVDRFRIQRVCKRWQILSEMSWETFKSFDLTPELWGIREQSRICADRLVLNQVLQAAGRYIKRIDLSRQFGHSFGTKYFRITACKNVFSMFHKHCPNINSITVGLPCSDSTLEIIANSFHKLNYFSTKMPSINYETYLSLVFRQNPNLVCIEMIECFMRSECLLDLNFDSVEELHIIDSFIEASAHLLSAVRHLKKLRKFSIVRCRCTQETWMNPLLRTLSANAENLTSLNLHLIQDFRDNPAELDSAGFMTDLKNLEQLRLLGFWITTDEMLEVISTNCKKLKELYITIEAYGYSSLVTNDGITSLTELAQLEHLHLDGLNHVTDQALCNLTQLKTLNCIRCLNIENEGLYKLLLNSSKLESMIMRNCEKIVPPDLIAAAAKLERCIDRWRIELDSSEVQDFLVECIHALTKLGNLTVIKTKTVCYECFKQDLPEKSRDCVLCANLEECIYK